VDWIDDADSRVNVISTALADLRGIVRLGTGLARGTIAVPVLGDPSPSGLRPRPGQSPARYGSLAGQLVRFIAVGVTCTVAYVLIYLLLRGTMNAQAANALSLLITAVANTALNRRLTFGIRGRAHAARHQLRGLIAFGIGLALTSGALVALHAVSPRPSRAAEVAVLILANLVATVVRFGLYRSWVFRGSGVAGRRSVDHPEPVNSFHPSASGPEHLGSHEKDEKGSVSRGPYLAKRGPDPVKHQVLDLSE
jgi:putative flippase GtrA